MKNESLTTILASAALLLCTGCPGESGEAPAASEPAAGSSAGGTAQVVDDADAALAEGLDLTGEEAASQITEDNADAEFDKLLKEISNDG